MKISGCYTLPVAPDRAYQILQDPATLEQAIPGCEGLEKTGPDEYRMKMKDVNRYAKNLDFFCPILLIKNLIKWHPHLDVFRGHV